MAGGVGVMTCLLALCWPLVKAPDVLDARSKISDGSRECDKTPKSHSVPSTGENKRGSAAKISVSLVKTVALVLANTMTYFVIKTMSDWTTPFLLETQGISNKEAVDVSFWTEVTLQLLVLDNVFIII